MNNCVLCYELIEMLTKEFIQRCNVCGHLHSRYEKCYCDHDKEGEIKIGIIKKSSFEGGVHMIVNVGDEDIWLEGPRECFSGKKEDYSEGKWIEMIAKGLGTIVGECDFGDINVLPLFVAERVMIKKD